MPRVASTTSIDELINSTVAEVIARVAPAIAQAIAEMAAAQLDGHLATGATAGRVQRRSPRQQRRAAVAHWVADARARRVPNFVIEMTGLETKKAIVAKYGANAAFERGQPLPDPK